jgi:hypothetical protein
VIALFAVLGGLGFFGLVIASTLYLFDVPARSERLRLEIKAQETAWRIQQHTRTAVEQMLDEARRHRS